MLLALQQVRFQVVYGQVIGILAARSASHLAIRGLQKAAVATEDFRVPVPCQCFEVGRAINNRAIVLSSICHQKGAGHVDRSEIDLWVRSK